MRQRIVDEARRWIGVRWRHQGRSRDGVDCVGLLIVVARDLCLLPVARIDAIEAQTAGYSRYPTGEVLRRWCAAELSESTDPAPGDVALFTTGSDPQHLGIIGDRPAGLSLIHAYALRPRKVIETIFDDAWRRRMVCAFSFPGH